MYLHSQFGNTDAHQGLEIPQWVISLFLLYLVNSSVGFRAKAKVNEILKFTSFKVVIPELALKDLDAKTESRLVRYPGTFKVHCIERSGLLQISVYWVHVKTPSDGNSQHLDIAEATLQRCVFLHQFVWLDIGWNECQDGCAKSAGILSQIKDFQTDQGIWFRDMPTSFLFALFRLADCYGTIEARNLDAAFVLLGVSWQDRGGQFIAGVWLGRGPAIMLSHVFEDSFSSCLSLTKHDMREVSWEQHQMKIELTCYILLQRRFHWIQFTWCL